MAYTNGVVFASTFASTASNYVSTGASSTLSTLSMTYTTNPAQQWLGGSGFLNVAGTFGAGSVTFGYVDAIGNSQSVVSFSNSGSATFLLPNASVYLSGGTTAAGRTIAVVAQPLPHILA